MGIIRCLNVNKLPLGSTYLHLFLPSYLIWVKIMKNNIKIRTPRKKFIFTYEKIGSIIGLSSESVRKLENTGAFSINDGLSIAKFILSRVLKEECRKN